MSPADDVRLPTVAQLAEHLFEMYRHPTRKDATGKPRRYWDREVETAIPGTIKHVSVFNVRKGEVKNPGREALLVYCRFFSMLPLYFFPELWPRQLVLAFWRCIEHGHTPQCPHVRLRRRKLKPRIRKR